MRSWKTTVGGLVAILGGALQVLPDEAPGAPYVKPWSEFLVAIGAGLIGLAARDNNITSEQAIRKPSDDTPTKT